MRIPYTPGFCDLHGEEEYSVERDEILNCSLSLSTTPAPLPTLLTSWLADRPFKEEQHYFNLKHWIDVLNKLDDMLECIVTGIQFYQKSSSFTFKEDDVDAIVKTSSNLSQEHKLKIEGQYQTIAILLPAAKVILRWTNCFLRCAFNKGVYNSVDVRPL
jgi:hypothetical protein